MCYETQMLLYEANSRGGHNCQNPRSRCQNLRFQYKGLVTGNMHIKYKSPITYHSKNMANVKVFADRQTNRRTGQKLFAPDLSMRGQKIG
jgi:hypothetical protein